MSKNVVVNGTTYNGVDSVKLPLSGGGYATFADAESGTSQTVELYSKTISEAAGSFSVPWDSAWNAYNVIVLYLNGVTMSAATSLRVGYNTTSFSGAGIYPGGTGTQTSIPEKNCLMFVKYNGNFYHADASAENYSNKMVQITPETINVFTTTSGVIITAGTFKLYGVK